MILIMIMIHDDESDPVIKYGIVIEISVFGFMMMILIK